MCVILATVKTKNFVTHICVLAYNFADREKFSAKITLSVLKKTRKFFLYGMFNKI